MRRFVVLSFAILSFCIVSNIQAADLEANFPPSIPLYPKQPVSDVPESIVSRNQVGVLIVRDVRNPTLTIYRPETQDEKRSAVIICPGGGYSVLAIEIEGHAYARHFQKNGITAIVLQYRLPTPGEPIKSLNELPLPQQDALAAIRYVRKNAKKLNISPNRIGIIGSSAGGHLAGSTAALTKPGDISRPDFVILLYPVTRMDVPEEIHKGSRDRLIGENPSEELINQYTLYRQVHPDTPPHFIVHSTDDTVVPVSNAMILADALIQAKVPLHLSILPQGKHGFSLGRQACPLTFLWKTQVIDWLKTLP